jgi:hypothetical protein
MDYTESDTTRLRAGEGTIYREQHYRLDYKSLFGYGDLNYDRVYLIVRSNNAPDYKSGFEDHAFGFPTLEVYFQPKIDEGMFKQFFSPDPQKPFKERLKEGIESQKKKIIEAEIKIKEANEREKKVQMRKVDLDKTISRLVGKKLNDEVNADAATSS